MRLSDMLQAYDVRLMFDTHDKSPDDVVHGRNSGTVQLLPCGRNCSPLPSRFGIDKVYP